MTIIEVKKSVAKKVIEHTIASAYATADCYGIPSDAVEVIREDLHELQKLEQSQLVDAAVELVTIGLAHAIKPTTETFDQARIVRDKLGSLMMSAKEIAG